MRALALALAALALTACETNQQRSAKLEKADKQQEEAATQRRALAQRALTITRQSTKVKVIATAVVHSSEGAAAIVTLRNVSNTALQGVPIQITVRNASGASIYTNATPGLAPSLSAAQLLPAHGIVNWIDDQVQGAGTPASVSAKVGEGTPVPASVTAGVSNLLVQSAHLVEGSTGSQEAEGVVLNHSAVAQQELVVYAVARRAGRIVAAGRAVLPQAPAGASTPFQLFFVGEPRGGTLEVTAPATTLG